MRILLFLIAVAIMPLCSNAQDLQPPVINQKSGDTALTVSQVKIIGKPTLTGTSGDQVMLNVMRMKDICVLRFKIQTGNKGVFTIKKDDKLQITMADSSKVTLKSYQTISSWYNHITRGSYVEAIYVIKRNKLSKITSQPIVNLGLDYQGGALLYQLDEKGAQKMRRAFSLVE
jgi:hypothetical protein